MPIGIIYSEEKVKIYARDILILTIKLFHILQGASPFQVRNYGPGPHWGTVRKKCPQVRYVSHVYYAVYILYNDYYFQIIIEVAQLRQHKQRLNDLRTQLG